MKRTILQSHAMWVQEPHLHVVTVEGIYDKHLLTIISGEVLKSKNPPANSPLRSRPTRLSPRCKLLCQENLVMLGTFKNSSAERVQPAPIYFKKIYF